MKKTLTIILLSISLSGFSQTEKGDWVVTPTVGWDTYRTSEALNYSQTSYGQVRFNLPISIHKYLSDGFAIGLTNQFYFQKAKNFTINNTPFDTSIWGIRIQPEARYNFLKSRFTPFIASRVFNITYQSVFADNPTTPVELRRISNLSFNEGLQIDIGISYFIKDRFGLQVKLMDVGTWDFKNVNTNFYTPINFGLQFIINNPRSEIESPR
ncbi:MAG: hypothetical protein RLZZ306_679 [Bacteroidota bacterium]|jgi:hypothetical protein